MNVALDAMQQEYDAVFPDQAYEEAIFKHYPIILRSFDMTREEVMQDFVLRTIAFAETSFDYMLVINQKCQYLAEGMTYKKKRAIMKRKCSNRLSI